jgi:membrane protease YdiL (CAAX protease family)
VAGLGWGYAHASTTMPTVPPPERTPSAPPAPGSPTGPEEHLSDEPRWPLWFAPGAVALGFGLGIVASIVVEVAARAGGHTASNPTAAESLIGDLLFDLGFVAAAVYFAFMRGRPRPEDFGFRRLPPATLVGAVLAAGISYYGVSALYASLLALHGSDKLPSPLGTTKSTAALAGVAIFVCVIAPIAEEFFFRGFIFGVLRRMRVVVAGRDLGTWLAAIITGILFGLAHTGSALSQDLIPLGFLGFVLCLLKWRTGSLYPCIALHSLNNALALGITQFHWNGGEILALMAGSLAVIAAITLPLSRRAAVA